MNRLFTFTFTCAFMQLAVTKGVRTFASFEEEPWHKFFYQLRREYPELQSVIGDFDWDGPYPESRFLKGIYRGLFLTNVICTDKRIMWSGHGGFVPDDCPLPLLAEAEKEKVLAIAESIPGLLEHRSGLPR